MTLKVICRLKAFLSAICRTFVQHFTTFQLTACSHGPSATAGFLVTLVRCENYWCTLHRWGGNFTGNSFSELVFRHFTLGCALTVQWFVPDSDCELLVWLMPFFVLAILVWVKLLHCNQSKDRPNFSYGFGTEICYHVTFGSGSATAI